VIHRSRPPDRAIVSLDQINPANCQPSRMASVRRSDERNLLIEDYPVVRAKPIATADRTVGGWNGFVRQVPRSRQGLDGFVRTRFDLLCHPHGFVRTLYGVMSRTPDRHSGRVGFVHRNNPGAHVTATAILAGLGSFVHSAIGLRNVEPEDKPETHQSMHEKWKT
jgi:hypothetical protein